MTGPADSSETLAAQWDQRYTEVMPKVPSIDPNAVLIDEASDLEPGKALDIGCGIGAEAIWLAAHGWDVTALDVSHVALDRAAREGRRAAVQVNWVHARLQDARLPVGGFTLVTAFYPALRHSPQNHAGKALLGSVAAGGTLLVVHHADVDVEAAKSYGFDPADYLSHDDVAAMLGDGWAVRVDRRRPRDTPAGAELQHTHDDVLVARRLR
ncbi:class I SAM-dependent methyltransferase [Mycobacterium spongiae]|uniref:Methyltransferase domain-containing protein n=1 Tax=Mycobacterium spongiae TaxID=886343 RepID=A0A975PYP2_9MYCO|nr:class I SAM-dependent methyltransferase [Mycobacterium spongiae]QUR68998.1 methyltransferase domain-containing protein [Mycobacterium spongiae]